MISIMGNCKKTAKLFEESGLRPRFEARKKTLASVLVRKDTTRGLRMFIREEFGKVQHVAWISEEEARNWTNSEISGHMHWVTARSKKGK